MKKNIVRIFAAVMALCCVTALTACNSTNSNSSSSAATESSAVQSSQAAEESSQVASEASEESSTETAGTAMYASIEEFVNSDEIQSQLSALQSDEMGVTVTGEDNKLIYTYTFAEGVETDGIAETLDTAIQAQAATFESIASSIALAVDVENPVVVVRYQDSQGNEIYSAEFTAAE